MKTDARMRPPSAATINKRRPSRLSMPGSRREQPRLLGGDWKLVGPYVADRAWATVREDYSADGDAWRYFPFD
jgi:hypothetical protein